MRLPPGRVRTAGGVAELLAAAERPDSWMLLVGQPGQISRLRPRPPVDVPAPGRWDEAAAVQAAVRASEIAATV